MAGIYIHVPFCWQRCHYCDFYSTLSLDKRGSFAEKLLKEISARKGFITTRDIDTIYFGGGTPSLLDTVDIKRIIERVRENFSLSNEPEITLEANPDDIDRIYLDGLLNAGVNRLSVGIQSFHDNDLRLLNRRHDAPQAIRAVKEAYSSGFGNISIDLIYELPGQGINDWQRNLEIALDLNPEHISAYGLTYEKGTNFYKWLREGKLKESPGELSLEMFCLTEDMLGAGGLEHYEISNFAREKKYSRHNTMYWFGGQYLGVGPAAHSYNGRIRQWTIADLNKWLEYDIDEDDFTQSEEIDKPTRRNEMLMTRLRTKWGIPMNEYLDEFGRDSWNELIAMASESLRNGLMEMSPSHLLISKKGKYLSDGIIAGLFIVNDT